MAYLITVTQEHGGDLNTAINAHFNEGDSTVYTFTIFHPTLFTYKIAFHMPTLYC